MFNIKVILLCSKTNNMKNRTNEINSTIVEIENKIRDLMTLQVLDVLDQSNFNNLSITKSIMKRNGKEQIYRYFSLNIPIRRATTMSTVKICGGCEDNVDFNNKTIQDEIFQEYKEKVKNVLSKRDFYVGNIVNKCFNKTLK